MKPLIHRLLRTGGSDTALTILGATTAITLLIIAMLSLKACPPSLATSPTLVAQRAKLLARWDALRLPHQALRAGDLVTFKSAYAAPDKALIFVRYLDYRDWDLASRRWLSDCVVGHLTADGERLCEALAVSHRLRPLTDDERHEVTQAAECDALAGVEG